MTYEVHFQHDGAQYTVRGPDIDGVLALIQGVQGAEVVPEYETRRDAAEATLRGLKYEWRGGEQWALPIGPAPAALWYPDAWIEWAGGERPVAADARVLVRLRDDSETKTPISACYLPWNHHDRINDIVAYKVVKPCE